MDDQSREFLYKGSRSVPLVTCDGIMTLIFDCPNPVESPLLRWDSRWKLAAFVPAIGLVAGMQMLLPIATAFLEAVLLILLSRQPLSWYFKRWAFLFPLLAALFVVLPLVMHGEGGFWEIGPVKVSMFGFLGACRLTLRALTIVSLALILLTTTHLPNLYKAAHCLYIPSPIVHIFALSYRYLFLLAEEFGRLRIALRLRGFRNRGNLHSYHTIGNVAGILLVRGTERAERVGQAMRSRGYDGQFHTLTEFRTTWADIGWFFLIMATAGLLFAWDWFLR